MFDQVIRAAIKSGKVKLTEKGASPVRVIHLALERQLDSEFATLLGGEADTALEGLKSGGMTKVILPIDAISASAIFDGKERLLVERMTGVKATASVGKAKEDQEAPLKIKLEFDMPFQRDVWLMLGDQVGDTIGMTLTRRQLEIPGTEKNGSKKGKQAAVEAKAGEAPKAKQGRGKGKRRGEPEGDPENDDPQAAATPAEAEGVREKRLAEVRAQEDRAARTAELDAEPWSGGKAQASADGDEDGPLAF